MNRYAVDVVLIPPDNMMSKAVELNRKLILSNPAKIELNTENCIPHISLSMGVLNESDFDAFTKEINLLKEKYSPLTLKCAGIHTVDIPGGEKVSGIAIENSEVLNSLHTDVMEISKAYMSNDAVVENLYAPPPVEDVTLHFINTYPRNSAYENFSPHITLGIGEMFDPYFTPEFTASELAVFQLGNYCTCRLPIIRLHL